jgi:hypothetical protein
MPEMLSWIKRRGGRPRIFPAVRRHVDAVLPEMPPVSTTGIRNVLLFERTQ